MEPCSNMPAGAHILNMILNALNVALATWLVNRRLLADRREANGGRTKLDQRHIDSGRADKPHSSSGGQ